MTGDSKGSVHLSGYFQPGPEDDEDEDMMGEDDDEDDDEDEEEEKENGVAPKLTVMNAVACMVVPV